MKKLLVLMTLMITAVFTSVSAEQITFEPSDITFYNFFSTTYGYFYDKDLVEFDNAEWTITIPNTQTLIFAKGGIESLIYFYDIDGDIIDLISFYDIYDFNGIPITDANSRLFGQVTIDLTNPDYGFPQDEISEIVSFRLSIMTTNTTSPGGFIDYLADNTFVTTGKLPTATFYHENQIYYQEQFNGTITGPDINPTTVDADDTLVFDQWVDSNGIPWNPQQPYIGDQSFYSVGRNQASIRFYSNGSLYDSDLATITEPYQLVKPTDPTLSGNVFLWWEFEDGTIVNFNNFYDLEPITNIYARFSTIGNATEADTNSPETVQGLSFILATLGWDNPAGYILLLAIILIPLNLLFAYISFPVFAIGIVNLALLGIFVFLQFLPFWAMFILIGSLIMAMIAMARGVINLE